MTQNSSIRYQPRSYHHLNEISIDTKRLYRIPTKTTNGLTKINIRKMIGIGLAGVTVIGVSLAMTLPFILNLNINKSNTTITASQLAVAMGSTVTTVTSIITTSISTTLTTTDTTSSTTTTTTTTVSTTSTTTTITTVSTSSTTTTTTTVSTTFTTTTDTTSSTTTTTTISVSTTSTTTSITTTTTTRNPYACSNMTILYGYDLSGSDLTHQYTNNYTLCCNFCLSNSSCMAYTWVISTGSNPCYLKYAVPSASANPTLISAHF